MKTQIVLALAACILAVPSPLQFEIKVSTNVEHHPFKSVQYEECLEQFHPCNAEDNQCCNKMICAPEGVTRDPSTEQVVCLPYYSSALPTSKSKDSPQVPTALEPQKCIGAYQFCQDTKDEPECCAGTLCFRETCLPMRAAWASTRGQKWHSKNTDQHAVGAKSATEELR